METLSEEPLSFGNMCWMPELFGKKTVLFKMKGKGRFGKRRSSIMRLKDNDAGVSKIALRQGRGRLICMPVVERMFLDETTKTVVDIKLSESLTNFNNWLAEEQIRLQNAYGTTYTDEWLARRLREASDANGGTGIDCFLNQWTTYPEVK